MIRNGQASGVLVIGSEVYSRILNWKDRGTCVLFGDGAGAVFLRAARVSDPDTRGVLSTHIHAQGTLGDILYVDGAVGQPDKPGHLVMNGREVFRHAVTRLAEAVEEALSANGLSHADVDWLVPHQANSRIIAAMGKKLRPAAGARGSHRRSACQHLGRLGAAGAGRGAPDGRIRDGDLVLLEALGGGLTWGSALVRL